MTRLIDADALKESIDKFHQKENDRLHNPLWGSIGLNALNRLIDYAPTIPLPDFKEGYKQAIRDGKTNFSRPQGKWIKTVMFGEKCLECDQCGKADFNIRHYKFCPDCGAEMEVEDGKTV